MLSIEVDSVTESEWTALLRQFDDATIYQTWPAAMLWGKSRLSHCVFSDGDRIAGIAQAATIKAPFINAGTALVFCGPLWRGSGKQRDAGILPDIAEALRVEYVERRGMLLRVIPNELGDGKDRFFAAFQNAGFQWKGRFYKTYLLDISLPSADLRKNLKQKWRNCLNHAEKENLAIVDNTSLEFYDTFLEIFREMQNRKQFSVTSIDPVQLTKIQESLPADMKPIVFLCMNTGKPLAGAVVSAIGDTAILLLAASNSDGRKFMASYVLQWKVIEWLQMRGFLAYDLGGTDPSHPWVNHFKAGLGGNAASHVGIFEQCSNPFSYLFDRSLGIMKNCKNHFKKIADQLRLS